MEWETIKCVISPMQICIRSPTVSRLREQVDIDSMDILRLMIGIPEATEVDIPEADYPQIASPHDCVAYLCFPIKEA